MTSISSGRPGAIPNEKEERIPDYVLKANPDADPIVLLATSKMQR